MVGCVQSWPGTCFGGSEPSAPVSKNRQFQLVRTKLESGPKTTSGIFINLKHRPRTGFSVLFIVCKLELKPK
jgi:hypothetical protein